MPGFDGTGPQGQGPRTGGGFGRCTDAVLAEDWAVQSKGGSRGIGRGGLPWGGGRGRCFGGGRRGFWGKGMGRRYLENDDQRSNVVLVDQIAQLIKDNEELRSRVSELESKQQEHI